MDLVRLFLASSIYIYIKNLKKTAFKLQSDFFNLDSSNTGLSISSDSLFIKTFCQNIVKILEINDPTLVDQKLKFKQDYLQVMYTESNTVKAFYEPMMQTRRTEISYWKTMKKSILQKTIEVICVNQARRTSTCVYYHATQGHRHLPGLLLAKNPND